MKTSLFKGIFKNLSKITFEICNKMINIKENENIKNLDNIFQLKTFQRISFYKSIQRFCK